MPTLRPRPHKSILSAYVVFRLATVPGIRPALAEDMPTRLAKAVAILNTLRESSGNGILPEEIASADCLLVLPGFYRGAAVAGVLFEGDLLLEESFGRGFISCRVGDNWSAPGSVTMEGGSLGVQIGEKIDIVILSLDKNQRSKLLSDRFTIGSDGSAVWGNGKSVPNDPNAKILLFGRTKKAFATFDLNGALLKTDISGNKALYGRHLKNNQIVEGGAAIPTVAQPLLSKLKSLLGRESTTP